MARIPRVGCDNRGGAAPGVSPLRTVRRAWRGGSGASDPFFGLLVRHRGNRSRAVEEERDHPPELVEAALEHAVGNRVEAAYARSDLFERRRVLMGDWAAYLAGGDG